MKRAFFIGAFWSIAGSFLMAALWTLFWRFPAPMSGIVHGWRAATAIPAAMLFYGVTMFLFPILGLAGGICGMLFGTVAENRLGWEDQNLRRAVVAGGLLVAFIVTGLLANWDLMFGPW